MSPDASSTPLPRLPRRRDDVNWVRVADNAVLFDPSNPRVHRLNATGALVWQCCDGDSSLEEICTDIAVTFDQDIESITESVSDVIAELAGAGLLVGTTTPGPRFTPDPDFVGGSSEQTVPVAGAQRSIGPCSALDLSVAVECHDSSQLADEVGRALQSLRLADPDSASAGDVTLTVWSDGGGGWNLEADGARLNAPDESVVCDYVLWQITRLAIERSPRYLVLHASAVARDRRAVIFPAQANSGKSTLAAILVEAGFDYLTDEAVAIDLDSGEVVAYPKPITLDPGTQQLLPHFNPGGLAGRSPKWRIAPTEIRPDSVVERAALAHIVLPTHQAGADSTLEPIETIDAVVGVLSSAFNLAEHADRLDDVVALVDRCTRHTLEHDGIDGPRVAVESLF